MDKEGWARYKNRTTVESRKVKRLRVKQRRDSKLKESGILYKICRRCEKQKSLNEFHKHSHGGVYARCKLCRNAVNRNRNYLLTQEQKKQRRINKKISHKRAKRKYNIRIKQEKLEAEVKANKELYLTICSEIVQGLIYQEIQLKYDLSKRFLKRLIKYEGNCYKTETVIDRIKPTLDAFYSEKSIREYSWDWLLSPISGTRMRVDLFYPINNLVVEFNGPQHYREIGYGNLIDVQLRDQVKYVSLKEHNIDLRIITKESEVLNNE